MLTKLVTKMQVWWSDLSGRAREDRGATAVEYAVMLALIAAVIVSAVAFLGRSTNDRFSSFKIP